MNISLNGKLRQIDPPQSVATLLEVLQLDAERVAVELNREVLLKAAFAATALQDGDTLEIVQFVGGG